MKVRITHGNIIDIDSISIEKNENELYNLHGKICVNDFNTGGLQYIDFCSLDFEIEFLLKHRESKEDETIFSFNLKKKDGADSIMFGKDRSKNYPWYQ